jgi:hypothetical protein
MKSVRAEDGLERKKTSNKMKTIELFSDTSISSNLPSPSPHASIIENISKRSNILSTRSRTKKRGKSFPNHLKTFDRRSVVVDVSLGHRFRLLRDSRQKTLDQDRSRPITTLPAPTEG